MNMHQVNTTDCRSFPDEKDRRQRIAKSLLDLQNIVPKSDQESKEGESSPRKASDAIEILEDTVDYIKGLHQEHPVDKELDSVPCKSILDRREDNIVRICNNNLRKDPLVAKYKEFKEWSVPI